MTIMALGDGVLPIGSFEPHLNSYLLVNSSSADLHQVIHWSPVTRKFLFQNICPLFNRIWTNIRILLRFYFRTYCPLNLMVILRFPWMIFSNEPNYFSSKAGLMVPLNSCVLDQESLSHHHYPRRS